MPFLTDTPASLRQRQAQGADKQYPAPLRDWGLSSASGDLGQGLPGALDRGKKIHFSGRVKTEPLREGPVRREGFGASERPTSIPG